MRKKLLYIVSVTSILMLAVPMSHASQGSLSYCQGIKDKIHYFTLLRKKGGSAQSMENWKQQRKRYEESFDKNNCKKWGRELKN